MPTCHIDLQFAQSGSMSCHLSRRLIFKACQLAFQVDLIFLHLYACAQTVFGVAAQFPSARSVWRRHFCSNKIGGARRHALN